jgi:hypothetical protein
VIFAILSGAELAGVSGIFLAIPVVAILTVIYRHWMEHRGSEGLADLLETAPVTPDVEANHQNVKNPHPHYHQPHHPDIDTTPEDMARTRPDLTTGELKMPE